MPAKDQRYDLDDVTKDAPLDEAATEEEDLEVDEFADQMLDDLDLQKDDLADEAFHDVTLPDAP